MGAIFRFGGVKEDLNVFTYFILAMTPKQSGD
jgi:hypothetical protein